MVSPVTYDPTRAAELFRRLAHPTELVLRRAYPHIDRQQVADAVVDAVMRLSATDLPDVELSLYRIARSRLRTRYRSEMRRQNRERLASGAVSEAAKKKPSVLEEMADREMYFRCRDRLAHSEQEKAVLDCWLGRITNLSSLAEQTGLSEGVVRSILCRFRQRMFRERQRDEDER